MAKQIAGLCFFEATFDDITFYKMEGKYYARAKSSLSGKRVKTSPEFKWTMVNARLLARASKIGSQVYKALPPGWRQFWMYRSFTGEAFTLLKEDLYNDEEAKQLLWKCYVEYWEQRKAIDPDNPIWQPKAQKVRKRRKYSEESIQRLLHRKDKYGRYKYPEYIKAEKKRIEREAREAWAKECEEKKQAALAAEALEKEALTAEAYVSCVHNEGTIHHVAAQEQSGMLYPASGINHAVTPKEPETPNLKPAILSPWYVTPNGNIYKEVEEACHSS